MAFNRLAEVYRQEKKIGGSLTSAAGKTLKESLDPRQMIDPKGIVSTLFPSLKPYKAVSEKRTRDSIQPTAKSSSPDISSLSSPDITELTSAMKVTAKNTLSIPLMARDINLIKTNIFRMTKALGSTPETKKTDIFWKGAKERESMLESAMKSVRKSSGFMGLSPTGLKTKRDGQSEKTALFVKADLSIEDMATQAALGSAAGGAGGGVMGKLKTLLPFVFKAALPVLGIAGIAGLLYFLIKKDSGDGKTIDELQSGGGYTPDMGGTAGPVPDIASDAELKRARENMRKSDDPSIRAAAAELDRQDSLKATPNQSEAESRRLGMSSAPTTPTPTTESVPSNVVRSGSGEPIRTGSGGYLTSGEETSPTKVESASIPSASGLPIDYKSYAQKIGEKESGGKYGAVNTLGYLGKYQFGAMALQDMGLVKKGTSLKGLDDPSNWNIEGGKQAFLNNAQLQEDTMVRYTKQNFKTLNRIGVINKDSSPQEIAGYLAASHLLGPGGAKELSKGNVGADAYGTSSASYFKVGSATQGSGTSVALASSTPTSGPSVSSASSSVSDGQRQAMIPSGGGNTVIDNSTKTTVASADKGSKTSSAYNDDLIRTLIASSA
jgi:hypothetical protein